MQIVLDSILYNDKVRYANAVDSIVHARNLHLGDAVPVNLNRVSFDLMQNGNKLFLPANV